MYQVRYFNELGCVEIIKANTKKEAQDIKNIIMKTGKRYTTYTVKIYQCMGNITVQEIE